MNYPEREVKMTDKLLNYLKHEEMLLTKLLDLSELQQKALVGYNINELEKITAYNSDLSRELRDAEEKRIKMMITWLGIPRRDAINMRLSDIESRLADNEAGQFKELRLKLNRLIMKLNNNNTTNRFLANKAQRSIANIIGILTNGSNHVCNVKV